MIKDRGPRWGFPICTRTSCGTRSHTSLANGGSEGDLMRPAGLEVTGDAHPVRG